MVGVQESKKHKFWGILKFKQFFFQPASNHQHHEKVHLGVLQHTTKFQAEVLTGKFCYWKKENIQQVPEQFLGSIFHHNSRIP